RCWSPTPMRRASTLRSRWSCESRRTPPKPCWRGCTRRPLRPNSRRPTFTPTFRLAERSWEVAMSAAPNPPLSIDVVSDVVCPWCYIGKRRLEQAIALKPDIPVAVRWHPYFLNPWVPREGMSRADYLTRKFGSVERYKDIAG